jgi:2-polyprenyl-6-methoxyphenol hydroxylase-like FAD-dependent oxidoreductase
MFNQPDLERLLHKRAATAGVDIRLGEQVTGLSQDDRRVTLETATGSRVTANYVVGCDGANSTVRRLAQLEFTDLGFFYDWLIVDVILDQPRRYDPINLQVCDPLRPTTLVSGGPGRRRWEFMCLPGESLDDLNSPERAWELLQVWDIDPDNARLERHAVYTFNARFAEQWRNGRILIAGDAAHQMPPFAGQGMCAGIRDAGNLAWKLDLVLTGRSPETLLDHYGPERRPEVRATIDFSMELGKVICVADPTEAASRDEAMSALVGPEPTEVPPLPAIEHGVIDQSSPHAGHLFPQGPVGDRLFDDVYGVGWTMLTTDSFGPVEPDVAEWFASIGGQIVTVPTDTPVYDRWFAEHDCRAALQRPDFHLFGTACDPGGIASLISRLRSLLSPIDPAQGAPS